MEDTSRRPRRAWQRVTPKQEQSSSHRETFRRDAPSPVEEVLAKHDAELENHCGDSGDADDDDEPTVFCF